MTKSKAFYLIITAIYITIFTTLAASMVGKPAVLTGEPIDWIMPIKIFFTLLIPFLWGYAAGTEKGFSSGGDQ